MRFQLRTLLIALALAPPALAGALWLLSTPRAFPVLGPIVLVIVLAVAIAIGRIAKLIAQR